MHMEKKTTSHRGVMTVAVNAVVMALYVALSLILPFSAGPIQFRLSESLNHLVVFDRRYLWGVFGGCVLYNALFGYGIMDVLFGGGQTLLALLATAFTGKYVKDIKKRMACNALYFTISMFMIAIMLHVVNELPFWVTYGTLMLSEAIIMTLSAPLMYYLNTRLDFAKRI